MLSEREMRILAFERSWWRQPGAKEREILEVFGIPSTRYYQLLNELIDRPEAMEFDPALVTRLRRQRARRHRMRTPPGASVRSATRPMFTPLSCTGSRARMRPASRTSVIT